MLCTLAGAGLLCCRYHVRFGTGGSPNFPTSRGIGSVSFTIIYTFTMLWIIVAIVSGTIIDNLGSLRDMRSRIADDLEQSCFICNISRSVFEDSNENGFNEHVKTQHNIRDYLSFMIHLEETDEFDYTPAEKYVATKLNSRSIATEKWFDWFPQRQAMVLRKSATARSAMVTSFMDVAQRMESLEENQQLIAAELRTELRRLASVIEGGDRRAEPSQR